MIDNKYQHSELTSKIIGCALAVHNVLGNGFQEVIYQRALALEMASIHIVFDREFEMPVFYMEQQIGSRRVDFMVEGQISVEIKAIAKLKNIHLAQAINYLEAYDLEVGLLVNFGSNRLEFKRLANNKFKQNPNRPK